MKQYVIFHKPYTVRKHGQSIVCWYSFSHTFCLPLFPLTVSNRPESIQMFIDGLQWATHYSTYMMRSESHLEDRKWASPSWALVTAVIWVLVSQWCGTAGLPFFVCVVGLHKMGSRGAGNMHWVGNVIVLFGPPCCVGLAFFFSQFLTPLTQHTQTHSHGQLPFNSQLGIRKLERWGELHKESTNVNKKRPLHALPYHATKSLALNSCSSLMCNVFTLCIHTRAGCLGDTQNGRTYVTKC